MAYLANVNAYSPEVRSVVVDITVSGVVTAELFTICRLPKGVIVKAAKAISQTAGTGTGTQTMTLENTEGTPKKPLQTVDAKAAAGTIVDLDTATTGGDAASVKRTPTAAECDLRVSVTSTSTVTAGGVVRFVIDLIRPSFANA